ncbi:fibrobacter succinogenes major paralogous domain-containing protein [uncultured Planktosalinus sp.]|mgnify:CR=1 FL=1|uniref:fibrobacter succinogenes major paralogous domain-containing protein n=1 Tax=uncultured Planktosalinus sp. TaxID=1810935 RepID=UPI0030D929AC
MKGFTQIFKILFTLYSSYWVFLFAIALPANSQNTDEIKGIAIGNQIWSSKNLAVTNFKNGDPISQAKTREDWIQAGKDCTPAWSFYENQPDIAKKSGVLYNWYAVTDPRGLAPEGWRIPTKEDFSELQRFLGGKDVAGKKIKATSFWFRNGHGDNSSGFNGIGGGNRDFEGYFFYIGRVACWWTTTAYDTYNAWYFFTDYGSDAFKEYGGGKIMGMSVRSIKE